MRRWWGEWWASYLRMALCAGVPTHAVTIINKKVLREDPGSALRACGGSHVRIATAAVADRIVWDSMGLILVTGRGSLVEGREKLEVWSTRQKRPNARRQPNRQHHSDSRDPDLRAVRMCFVIFRARQGEHEAMRCLHTEFVLWMGLSLWQRGCS